jgi:hypothetical protein
MEFSKPGPESIGACREGDYIHYLKHDGPEHPLCVAPTRSGKGVGIVIPSLLAWQGSTIVIDIKGKNWNLTPGFRSKPRFGRINALVLGSVSCGCQRLIFKIAVSRLPDGPEVKDVWTSSLLSRD